jgi:hypothetical protein
VCNADRSVSVVPGEITPSIINDIPVVIIKGIPVIIKGII